MEVADGNAISSNTKTFYVRYTSSGNDNETSSFSPGDTLVCNNAISVTVLGANTAIGKGSKFSINRGVVYAKGFFVNFDDQSIILDRYGTKPTYTVGFNVKEDVVNYLNDYTLLDPARGS